MLSIFLNFVSGGNLLGVTPRSLEYFCRFGTQVGLVNSDPQEAPSKKGTFLVTFEPQV